MNRPRVTSEVARAIKQARPFASPSQEATVGLLLTADVVRRYAEEMLAPFGITLQVRHLVTKVRGRFRELSGTIQVDRARPERSSVDFTIEAASVDTDLPDRDAHLRSADFFDVEKHPRIRFVSSRIEPRGDERYDVTGTLTLRGVARTVALPVTFLGFAKDPWGNERAGFELETTLNRKDYDMVFNAALDNGGLLLGDEVRISINLETLRQKAEKAA